MLKLEGTFTASALADICILIPNLRKLALEGITVAGTVSEIAPHCTYLEELKIKFNAEGGGADQYAPLAHLPNLKDFIITGIYESGSEMLFFKSFEKLHRPRNLRPSILTIEDSLFHGTHTKRSIIIPAFESLLFLELYLAYFDDEPPNKITFDLCEISENSCFTDDLLVAIPETKTLRIKFDRYKGELELKLYWSSDISQFGQLSKLPNFDRLVVLNKCTALDHPESIAKFLQSMVPKGQIGLKSCKIHYGPIDELETIEIAKIKSIRSLGCHVWEWNSIKLLSQLPNLDHLVINVRDTIDSFDSKILLDLITACQVQATILCNRFSITIKKTEKHLEIKMKRDYQLDALRFLAQLSFNTLTISGDADPASLNPFLDAFVTSNFSTIQELDISELQYDLGDLCGYKFGFEDISKVAELQSIRKLKLTLFNTNGIEKLGELNNLEELAICAKGRHEALFIKLAEKNTIRSISCSELNPNEFSKVSRIRSLKKLVFPSSASLNLQSFFDLANSSIEEFYFQSHKHSLQQFISAFSSNKTTRLQHLHVYKLDISQNAEVKELKCLKRLVVKNFSSQCAPTLNKFPELEYLALENYYKLPSKASTSNLNNLTLNSLPLTLQTLDISFYIGFGECNYLVELKKLNDLKCSLRDEPGVEVLANIQNLRKLTIDCAEGSLTELYRAFALMSKLQELHAWIPLCSDDIREIWQIKSLTNLSFWYQKECDNLAGLGELLELKSLHIVRRFWERVDIESVLPIFKSSKKLQYAELKGESVATNLASRIHKILKSVRDPALQGPLKLCIIDLSPFPNIHVDDIDEAYLNVSYSYETPDDGYCCEFLSERRNSSDSQTFCYSFKKGEWF
ncbi:uncharacterized protein LOC108027422 isoform X2 [Drosophila biarmipes]|nr:uncharacterized protein LOC108027422 isoform X2 [Drosophila biarmipes]